MLGKSTDARVLKQQSTCFTKISIGKVGHSRDGASLRLKAALFAWIHDQPSQRRMISGPWITSKARGLQVLCNGKLTVSEHLSLSFSGGWTIKFKCCWGLNSFTYHGESGDADAAVVSDVLPSLLERISAYYRRDVFNADECALFCNLTLNWAISVQRSQRRK